MLFIYKSIHFYTVTVAILFYFLKCVPAAQCHSTEIEGIS